MKVFLVRHGDADAEIPEGLSDEARALTNKARATLPNHFGALKERLGTPNLVLTSPLVRCAQTSMLLVQALGYEGPLKTHRALLPDMPVGAIDSILRDHSGNTVVLVGHQPSMGAMASHLLGMQQFPKPVNPGTVIGLEVRDGTPEGQPPQSTLLFYAPPGQAVLEQV